MPHLRRRQAIHGALATAAIAMSAPAVHGQNGRRTLRFIAEADLKVLDPVWTSAYITRNHSYLVYDTLFGTDEKLQIKPQMVERTDVTADGATYTFTLREDLRWHDGKPVLAEDCVESLKRWGKRDRFGQFLMSHIGKLVPLDRRRFTLQLQERFGLVLEALGGSRGPFMMPARVAAASADEQIKEVVGSGPFRFLKDEWQAGEQAVYERNPSYVPRDERPSGSTGGKHVHIDRVVWRYIPDPWEAVEALATNEVDWWQEVQTDMLPKIEQHPDIATFVFDHLGSQGWLRPNCLHPPFNNSKARQALHYMMDQETYLSMAIGPRELWRTCHSVYPCGTEYATETDVEPPNIEKARALVQESGYNGQPLVLLHVIDRPFLNAAAIVSRSRLQSIGFKVVLMPMDWSTSTIVRARQEPPEKGGWNLLHTWWVARDLINPVVHFGLSGAGRSGWFGWPEIPALEKLTSSWVRETDKAKRAKLAGDIQKVAFAEVPYVPWGQWFTPTAFRKNVRDVLKFGAPLFWNVKLD